MSDQKIELPNGDQLLFPADMPDTDIQTAIETEYPQFKASARSTLPTFDQPAPTAQEMGVQFDQRGLSTPITRAQDILTDRSYATAKKPLEPVQPEAPLPAPGLARAMEESRRNDTRRQQQSLQDFQKQQDLLQQLDTNAPRPIEDVLANAFEATNRVKPDQPIRPPQEGFGALDIPKTIAAAIYQSLGMPLQGGGELLARGTNIAGEAIGLKPDLRAINPLQDQIDSLLDSRTPTAKRAEAESQISGELLKPNTWSFGTNPSALGYILQGYNAVAQAAPSLALALSTAGLSLPQQFTIGSVFGGMQGFGGSLDQERQAIASLSDTELAQQSKLYSSLRERGVPNSEARKAVADAAALGGGIGNGTLSGLEQGFENVLVGALTKGTVRLPSFGAGTLGRTVAGLGGGAALGGVEESGEQAGQNIGSNVAIGGDRPIGQDTLQNAIMGAIGQGVAGGVVGAISPAEKTPSQPIRPPSLHEELASVLQHPTPAPEKPKVTIEDMAEGAGTTVDYTGKSGAEAKAMLDNLNREAPFVSPAQGTPSAPIKVTSPEDVATATQRVNLQPTEAQKEAGNYSKGHINWNGLDISIENPAGTTRSGLNDDGTAWNVQMPNDYGYIKRTEGADGDQVDVYLGPDVNSPNVFIIDQIDPATGKFDEHKNMLGFDSVPEAITAYQGGFSDGSGASRMGAITQVSLDDFKAWLKDGKTDKAVTYVNRQKARMKNVQPTEIAQTEIPQESIGIRQPVPSRSNVPLVYSPNEGVNYREPSSSDATTISPPVGSGEGTSATENVPLVERRTHPIERKKVAAMTHEELRYALLTDHLTDTNNRRAYEEASKLPIQASVDVDSLKWVNDNLGHAAGDKLLQTVAAALKAQTGETYHISGDEFVVQGRTIRAVNVALKAAQETLRNAKLEATDRTGNKTVMNGIGFSYGSGKTLAVAEEGLHSAKTSRERAGLRAARGEIPPGIITIQKEIQNAQTVRSNERQVRARRTQGQPRVQRSPEQGGGNIQQPASRPAREQQARPQEIQKAEPTPAIQSVEKPVTPIAVKPTATGLQSIHAPLEVLVKRVTPARSTLGHKIDLRPAITRARDLMNGTRTPSAADVSWLNRHAKQLEQPDTRAPFQPIEPLAAKALREISAITKAAIGQPAKAEQATKQTIEQPLGTYVNEKRTALQQAVRENLRNMLHNPTPEAVAADIRLNKLLGGDNETLSARIGKAAQAGNPLAKLFAKGLDNLDPGHIERALGNVQKETEKHLTELSVEHKEAPFNFAEDMLAQTKELQGIAKREGFKTIQDFITKKPDLFSAEAASWRARHPIPEQRTEEKKPTTIEQPAASYAPKQPTVAPIFYSQLAKQITASPDRIFQTGRQVAAWLESNAPKLGIKKDEIEATGIKDWLKLQGKVSKAEVQQFLAGVGAGEERIAKTFGTDAEAQAWAKDQVALARTKPTAQQQGFTITPEMRSTVLGEGLALFEPGANYDVSTPAHPGEANTLAVRQDPESKDVYHVTAELVSVGTRTLPTQIVTIEEAAQAFSYQHQYAVEHYDAIVTDANGKPLAIIGSFKGAATQTSVFPSTVLQELALVPGAKALWASHNHPSGTAQFSQADLRLSATFAEILRGSGVQYRGLFAMTRKNQQTQFAFVHEHGDPIENQILHPAEVGTTQKVQIQERTISGEPTEFEISSPQDAKRYMPQIAKGEAGVILLSAQQAPVAFIALTPEEIFPLRENGRFLKLVNKIAKTNAEAAFLVNPNNAIPAAHLDNLAASLAPLDIRALDILTYKYDPDGGVRDAQALSEKETFNPPQFFLSKADQAALDAGGFASQRLHQTTPYEAMVILEKEHPTWMPSILKLVELGNQGKRGGVIFNSQAQNLQRALELIAKKRGVSVESLLPTEFQQNKSETNQAQDQSFEEAFKEALSYDEKPTKKEPKTEYERALDEAFSYDKKPSKPTEEWTGGLIFSQGNQKVHLIKIQKTQDALAFATEHGGKISKNPDGSWAVSYVGETTNEPLKSIPIKMESINPTAPAQWTNGFYSPELGLSFLNTDHLAASEVPGVLLHEILHQTATDKETLALGKEVLKRIGVAEKTYLAKAFQPTEIQQSQVIRSSDGTRFIVNPTRAQAATIAKQSVEGEIRSLRDPDTGVLYIWDAAYTTHEEAAKLLGIDYKKAHLTDHRPGYKQQIFTAEGVDNFPQNYFSGDGPLGEQFDFNKPSFLQSVAPDQTQTPEFKRWFGNSKVVNAEGKPLVVYHGGLGAEKIVVFDASYGGQTTGNNEHGAFHFTDDKQVAEDYGRQSFIRRYQDDPESLIADGIVPEGTEIDTTIGAEYGRVSDLAEENIGLQTTYLKINNPIVIDMHGERIDVGYIDRLSKFAKTGQDEAGEFIDTYVGQMYGEYDPDLIAGLSEEIAQKARENYGLDNGDSIEPWQLTDATDEVMQDNGYEREQNKIDGIIIKNMVDDIGDYSNIIANQYIVFEPTQIKSALENTGSFDPTNPSILQSGGGRATGDNIYARVKTRMENAGVAGDANEAANYLVEEAMNMGSQAGHSYLDSKFWAWAQKVLPRTALLTLKRWIAAIRAALYKRGIIIKAEDLRVDDIAAVAVGNMSELAAGKREAAQPTTGQTSLEFQQSLKTLTENTKNALETAAFNYVDEFGPLHKWQKTLGKVSADQDASMAQQRYSGIVAARVEDFHDDMVNPLLEAIHASGIPYQEVEQYLYAKHAPSRNAEMEKINPGQTDLSGMSNVEAANIIRTAEQNGSKPALEAIAKQVYAITAKTRDNLVQGGLLTPEERLAWEAKYKNYVPLHRDEVQSSQPPLGKGFSIKGPESKRALGSTQEATNILSHTLAQHEASIIRVEKNKVSRTMFNLLSSHPDSKIGQVDSPDIKKVLDKSTGTVDFRVDPFYKNQPHVLALKIDGVEHTLSFNMKDTQAQRMAYAFKNLGGKELGEVTLLVGKFTRFLATMSTSANPVFLARNFLRDLQTAAVNLNDTPIKNQAKVFLHIPSAMRGFYAMSKDNLKSPWAKYAREYRDAGGQVGWLQQYKDIEDRAQHYKDLVGSMRPGILAASQRTMKLWWSLVEDANAAVENAVRLSAYVTAREEGISEAEAAMIAKNLTVNFNIRGAKSVELNMWYMFAKASINGTARMFRAAKNPKVQKIMGGMVVIGFLLDALARGLAGDDDDDGENDYDQLPEYTKANNWVFWVAGKPVTIPQSYGLNFFPNVGRKVSQLLFQKGYHAPTAALDIFNVAMNAYSPLGTGGSLLQTVAPTIADPFIQLAENTNFAGQPIHKTQMGFGPAKPEYQMGFKSASAMSQAITKWLNDNSGGNAARPGAVNLNPSVMDFAVASIFGGAGKSYMQALSLPAKLATDKEIEAREVPFANIFLSAKPQQQVQRKYHEALQQIQTIAAEYKDPAVVNEDWKKDHAAEIALIGYSKRVEARIKKINGWEKDLPALLNNSSGLNNLETQIRAKFPQYTEELDRGISRGNRANTIVTIEEKILEAEKTQWMQDFNKKFYKTVVK